MGNSGSSLQAPAEMTAPLQMVQLLAGFQVSQALYAAIMSDAFGETVLYEPVTTKEYASAGFPGAQELANQFQYFDEGTEMFSNQFSIKETRSLNPALQGFTGWLKVNRSRIPAH